MYIKRSRILYDAESGIFLVCLGALVSVCVVQLWKRSWVPFSVPTMIFSQISPNSPVSKTPVMDLRRTAAMG